MKIEICIEGGKEGKEKDMPEGMPKKPSAFHIKVAKMLAKQKGRAKPSDMDLEKAMELDEEDES